MEKVIEKVGPSLEPLVLQLPWTPPVCVFTSGWCHRKQVLFCKARRGSAASGAGADAVTFYRRSKDVTAGCTSSRQPLNRDTSAGPRAASGHCILPPDKGNSTVKVEKS